MAAQAAERALTYVDPDPFAHVFFPDGQQLTMWLDPQRSTEEIARFSRRDAETYQRMIADYDRVKHIFGADSYTPPGFGPSIEKLLADHPRHLGVIDLAVRASREDFTMSLKHVRQATEDLREFSRIIAQDPSVLLRGKEASE